MKMDDIWDWFDEIRREGVITRRLFLSALVAGSAAAALAPFIKIQEFVIPLIETFENTRKKIANINDLEPNSFIVFSYPGEAENNPRYSNMLIRMKNGEFKAYNRICTHLQCLVTFEAGSDRIFCPCHAGTYNVGDGKVRSGPPPRALPEVILEIDESGDIWAIDMKGEIGRGR